MAEAEIAVLLEDQVVQQHNHLILELHLTVTAEEQEEAMIGRAAAAAEQGEQDQIALLHQQVALGAADCNTQLLEHHNFTQQAAAVVTTTLEELRAELVV